ncbi:MAG: hypothetical protein ACK5GN_03075 [Pseudomonadota bacterium]
MDWAKHRVAPGIEIRVNSDQLTELQTLAADRAATQLPDGFAPQTFNHRAACFLGANEEDLGTGTNTDGSQREKHCAELSALARAVANAARSRTKVAPTVLAVMSKRYEKDSNNQALSTARKHIIQSDPPVGPCGTCLTAIQGNAACPDLSDMSVIMGAGSQYRRASFGTLYPIPTVSALRSVVFEDGPRPHGLAVMPSDSCCDAIFSEDGNHLQQKDVDGLFTKVYEDLKFSQVESAPNLRIAYGYITPKSRNAKRITETLPLIDQRHNTVGRVGGVLTLCSGNSVISDQTREIKGLLIAVEYNRDELGAAASYQFFTGTERQRIFDIADISKYDIPVFISWNREKVVVTNISALAPLYEGPTDSRTMRAGLDFYRGS